MNVPELVPAASSPVMTGWVSLPVGAGQMSAYLALPPAFSAETPAPAVLLLQEIFGVNVHIRSVAEQYAQAGFIVLAPDLFWRHAYRIELGYVGAERDTALGLMKTVQRNEVVEDMAACVSALKGLAGCNGQVAALGYCMGGRLAFTAAAFNGVDRAVAYYGGGIANQLDLAPQIRVPMMFHHAAIDASIPPEAVAQVQAALAASPASAQDATRSEFFWYPDAQHGFNCWARAAWHPASAALAIGRTLNFLSPLFELQGN